MKFNNVYVKNSVESTIDEGLKDVFTEHGAITSAVMMRDANEKSKCFEFVNFEKAEDVDEAIKTFNGKEIDGEECYVGKCAQGWQNEDPLDDTASHAPMILPEILQREVGVIEEDERPNETREVPPVTTEQQERSETQPSAIPTSLPPQSVDPGLLAQIVKAVMEGIAGADEVSEFSAEDTGEDLIF
ncbi:hypothetical protein SADUNF_Sadunf18G0037600 [Salix dunnii]|uniref:RRM domain-containing protein n=1 Tax=Salix dunnii TaxID=1413687 RepID=A0A835J7L4_9ROSI|nr:hypothetical protein SADUNF_Sadunf18G0037600 [Salix dunnii]